MSFPFQSVLGKQKFHVIEFQITLEDMELMVEVVVNHIKKSCAIQMIEGRMTIY